MPKGYKSITRRIFFWMCIVALAPLVIAAGQGYHCARQAVIEGAENHLLSVLNSRKAMLIAWMEERKDDIRALSAVFGHPEYQSGSMRTSSVADSAACLDLLQKVRQVNSAYESIVILDPQFNPILSSSQASHTRLDFLTPEFQGKLKESTDVIVGESHMHENGRIGAHFGFRYANVKGDAAGYILANIDLSTSIDTILKDRSGLGRTGKAYLLFRSEGRVYEHMFSRNTHLIQDADLERLLAGRTSGIKQYKDDNGNKVIGAAVEMPEIQSFLVVEIDRDEAFAWVDRLAKRAIITGILTLIGVFIIAYRSSAHISNPLRKLVEVSRRIAAGSRTERLDNLDGGEVQEVSVAFNKMLDTLAESQQRMIKVSSLAAVGEMSSSIVHEMRSPLSSIKLNFQAFQNRLKGDPDFAALVKMSLKQFSRLEKMLSDLLNYGKPIEIRRSPVVFADLVREVLEIVHGRLEKKNIQLEVHDGLEGRTFIADPELIRVALTNLMTNAVEATSNGGEITIEATLLTGEVEAVRIAVRDNGEGIPEGLKPNLFKPFFSTRKDGTGLGLANIKKIVDYHGGSVSAENVEPHGALFSMILPGGGPAA